MKLRRLGTWLVAVALLVPGLALAADSAPLPVKVAPGHKEIRYTGRFDMADGKAYRFGWSACQVQARFEGTALNMLMQDEASGGPNPRGGNRNNYFNIIIDDRQPVKLSLEKDRTVYRIADGLPEGQHTVAIFRRTEPLFNACRFMGLELEAGRSLKSLPPRPERRIELVGDSITAGYGNEEPTPQSPFLPSTSNVYMTYGAMTARNLGAEFVCFAWSGQGIYRDRGEKQHGILPVIYKRTLPADPESVWDFQGPQADAIVINLGTNDFAFTIPPKEPFTQHYRDFIKFLRQKHPQAHVFCCVGPMMGDTRPKGQPGLSTCRAYINEMIAALKAEGENKVHYVEFDQQRAEHGKGASYHPNVKTHTIMAERLTKAIKEKLGW